MGSTALEGVSGAFTALLAGVIQGVSEWLPVSSKTLLLLLFMGFGLRASDSYLLGLFLNGATVAAASIYFRRELLKVLTALPRIHLRGEDAALLRFLLASLASTALVAVPLAIFSLKALESAAAIILVGVLLAVTGIISWRRERVEEASSSRGVGVLEGLIAGVAQGFSALPGISRSGITLFALLLMGYRPREALRLSFLMGIPATLGGSLYALSIAPTLTLGINPLIVLAAFTAATAASIPTIDFLLKISIRVKTYVFTLGLAALTILAGVILLR